MDKILFNTLEKHQNHISFHTPGHSGRLELPLNLDATMIPNSNDGSDLGLLELPLNLDATMVPHSNDGGDLGLFKKLELPLNFDITELTYSDNLLNPTGPIKAMQENISEAYGVDNMFLLSSGATTGVQIAITSSKLKEPFLILEPAHKSIFRSLQMINAKAYVLKRIDDLAYHEIGIYPDKVYEEIEDALNKTKAKTLILTSPNYFGNIICDEKIKRIKDKYNINIILDAAHGSHFPFSPKLPKLNTKIYDYVIFSMHKTLPVLTGGAGIAVKNKDKDSVKITLQDLHSTSPSYLTLLSIEQAVSTYLENGNTLYNKVFSDIENFKKALSDDYAFVESDDKTRVVIEAPNGNIATKKLEENEIFIEMTYDNFLVLIVTPFNSMHLEKVSKILNSIKYPSLPFIEKWQGKPKYDLIELKFTNNYEMVLPKDAVGKVAYREFGIYPPGVPLVYSGQIITKENIDLLENNDVFGLIDGKILIKK
ncbi:MAG TPA: aminotransferase class I/II-fold pyridoxal phosphate-dependent enzyme [Clostridiales bacterium]|nr:aminotransferase class I/II-fold pyridoxal phosphate-dependent enzyme [Clostridiales bacterium]